MTGKKERKAGKNFEKKLNKEKKATKAELRQEITERNSQHKKALAFGHHCPEKDAATTHTIKASCIKKNHVGYCPICFEMVSAKYGCSIHKWKGNKLEDKLPSDLAEALAANRSNGLLGPAVPDARTIAAANEAAAAEAEAAAWQEVEELAEQRLRELLLEEQEQQEAQQEEGAELVQAEAEIEVEIEEPILPEPRRRRRANEPR